MEEGDKPPREVQGEGRPEAIKLSLEESILLALKNNLDIAEAKLEPKIREADIVKAKSEFDPALSFTIDRDRSVRPITSPFLTGVDYFLSKDNVDINAAVRSKLISGAELSLDLITNRYLTNSIYANLNPSYTTDLVLSVEQPLLRGFGFGLNLSYVKIARNSKDISYYDLRQRVAETLSLAQQTYWDLVFAIENLRVKQTSLERAKQFLEETRARVEVGVLAPVEILAAEAEVAKREEDVIVGENLVKDFEDRLRQLINPLKREELWELRIIPTDKPRFTEERVSLEENLHMAFTKRDDYKAAQLDLKNRDIQVRVAENHLLPKVDFVGSIGLNGLAGVAVDEVPEQLIGKYGQSFEMLTGGNHYEYSFGAVVEYPLGNRLAKSNYTQRKLEVLQGLTGLKNLESRIEVEVREAVRAIQVNINRVKSTRVARELAEEKLEAEEKKFEVGMSTSFQVLEFQEDLAEAQSNETRAIIDYNKSLVRLEEVNGTINEAHHVSFEKS